jgi:hypothetical protein
MTFTTSTSRDTETCTPEIERESPRRPCHSADDAVLKWALDHLRPVDGPSTKRSSGEG